MPEFRAVLGHLVVHAAIDQHTSQSLKNACDPISKYVIVVSMVSMVSMVSKYASDHAFGV